MNNRYQKFFSLLRFSVSEEAAAPEDIESDDWSWLYELTVQHTLAGVVYRGITRLPYDIKPSREIVMSLYVASERIAMMNRKVNVNAVRLTERFAKDSKRCCILKGQGNTLYYPDSYMRTPGDIDVWVEGCDCEVIKYMKRIMPSAVACYHHIDAPAFGGTSVEVHYRPSFQFNFIHNERIQRWFRECADEQFSNVVMLPEKVGSIAVPTLRFNRVFQMSHIANHILHEGIGLRQIMDYYFLLKQGFSEEERTEYEILMKRFGMYKMSRAVMYVLREVFGLEERLLIVEPHERCGRMLLEEIMLTGNFGHHDKRLTTDMRKSRIKMNFARLRRDWRMMRFFPSESVAEPFFRMYHFFWRVCRK